MKNNISIIVQRLAGLFCVGLLVSGVVQFTGCDSAGSSNAGGGTVTNTDDHDHDHGDDHDHDHADHGPNHGHLIAADAADMGLEWTHSNQNNIIRVFLLDAKKEKNQAAKVDSVTVTRATGNTSDKWVLTAVNPNEKGESAEYMLDSEDLNRAMALGVNVEVKMGDKVVKGTIPPHAPHDH